ncbi:acetyl/propionyl/methylcrotonyl-CoA carboxylase subunit alpha [uncultured Cohaesibacter sp.]|uniref:acetyl/propionyl/methylcrotonyl-CoA carboxylase subunit alpha n=1 Tax=uncultured Cohaesibacter sp. TaxID=1002546 RepID=UPI0029C66861|nr:acetyl/propionyl/methylcrotonyl-CoA carboxylase subunit alpha [uncultured Cohaesibacter sp.]
MMKQPFEKILIANRGEIACRIIRTARALGIRTVAVYSDADRNAQHVAEADEAVHIGPSSPSGSYLRGDVIIRAALGTGAVAIHPGYGFLSENAAFVDAVEAAGLVFIGPSADAIRAMGLKDAAKTLMQQAGVPVVPGYLGDNQDPVFLADQARDIGFPVLIKARAGGGGKGMRKVDRAEDFAQALQAAQREARSAFGDDQVLVEKFISAPRHIEVQVFGDSHGTVLHLFERDCSLQRRHQKVMEEAPAPGMTPEVRSAMTEAAVKAARAIGYCGAGTIEFIVDGSGPLRPDGFWFMEMNTRLQVEHPVTEAIVGVDLVEWQLRVAAGEPLPCRQEDLAIDGHAFEARLYAEDPFNDFLPATGILHHLSFDEAARNDTGVRSGDAISPFYDPMIAKIITHAALREDALASLRKALAGTHVAGATTNAGFLAALAAHDGFGKGAFDTGLIDRDLPELVHRAAPGEVHLAFAAMVALDIRPLTQCSSHRGWRLWGEAKSDIRLLAGSDCLERTVIYEPDGSITLRGGECPLTLCDLVEEGATRSARIGPTGRRLQAHVIRTELKDGILVSVLCNGMTHDFIMPDASLGSAGQQENSSAVLAPMTGIVIQLSVSAGDSVRQGDSLGIMEAMKMETSFCAPRDGVIASVACAVGSAVEGGSLLVALVEAAG